MTPGVKQRQIGVIARPPGGCRRLSVVRMYGPPRTLEDDGKKLMTAAVEAAAPMLEARVGANPDEPMSVPANLAILQAQLGGLRRAVLRLAREIDEMRDI